MEASVKLHSDRNYQHALQTVPIGIPQKAQRQQARSQQLLYRAPKGRASARCLKGRGFAK